ncbi:hypothetical protein C8J57DRAFT_1530523 [Mycena rebaudengoi]|nr:hypothetical protein C8J57DRAFT_1530523 [Mycena rebaudengoi]
MHDVIEDSDAHMVALEVKFIAVLLAAASVVFATNTGTGSTLSSFNTSDCSGTPLATFTGIPDTLALCQAGNATSLKIVLGIFPAN